ncbi:hypothetical protein [Solirhodobacter olei]|uniref:hypothetical protein n=1 Tax=Solirhodobacter olei TaxID=2493082 RepID=UPI000FD6EFB4|nr:hypothetical protein [Solirhodobacter olei]
MASIAEAPAAPVRLIRLEYLWYVALALAVMVAAIVSQDIWFLNWVHVMSGVLWTGIDLFMGFVLGPILRSMDVAARKQVLLRLTPKMLFAMPTLAIITGTAGWFLASDLGYTDLAWPQIGWIYGALVLVTLMTIQGLGYLLPTNLRVCFELQKQQPDGAKIGRLMSGYFYAVAAQGLMQVAIIVIMARIVAGI